MPRKGKTTLHLFEEEARFICHPKVLVKKSSGQFFNEAKPEILTGWIVLSFCLYIKRESTIKFHQFVCR